MAFFLKQYVKKVRDFFLKKTIKRKSKYYKCYNQLMSELESKNNVGDESNPLIILTTYNDHDIIQGVIDNNIELGFDIVIIDNWSSDGTWSIVEQNKRDYNNIKKVIRYPLDGPSEHFNWKELLEFKTEIALGFKQRWVLHQDSDEITISAFNNYNVKQTLSAIKRLGYNVVSLKILDFLPVDNDFSNGDPVSYFKYYHISDLPFYNIQNKIWYQEDERVDLAGSGGHNVEFVGARIFPIRLPRLHYSIRSIEHAKSKFSKKRMDRASLEKEKLGWHSHLDVKLDSKVIYNKDDLLMFDYNDLYTNKFEWFINYEGEISHQQ